MGTDLFFRKINPSPFSSHFYSSLQSSFAKGWRNEALALADTIKNFRNIAILLIPNHRYTELTHELFVCAVVPVQETINHQAWDFQLMSTIATLEFFEVKRRINAKCFGFSMDLDAISNKRRKFGSVRERPIIRHDVSLKPFNCTKFDQ